MLLFNYLKEIKNRVFFIFLSWLSVFIVSYLYKETLVFLLVKLSVTESELIFFYFIATNLTDIFKVYVDIAYFVSFQVFIIIVCCNLFMFFTPALFVYEYKKIKFVLVTFFVLTIIGIYLLNTIILPYSFSFFLAFNKSSSYNVDVFFEFKITEYVQFYKSIYYIIIFLSQFFSLIFILFDSIKSKIKFILSTRKIFYIIFLLLSTLLTPPDILGQLLSAFILVVYFEFLIIIIIFKNYLIKFFIQL